MHVIKKSRREEGGGEINLYQKIKQKRAFPFPHFFPDEWSYIW
jgi:hypothetical protein